VARDEAGSGGGGSGGDGSGGGGSGEGGGVPEEAFALFGHGLRLEILHALGHAEGYSLGFAELRRAVDERDSGRFSYHLSKLEGQFVRKVRDAYELQYAGHRVIDAIRSGVFHRAPAVEATALPERCRDCGDRPAFAYEAHIASVRCETCDRTLLEYPFEPGAFEGRTVREAAGAFDRRTRGIWTAALDGLCTICTGTVEAAYASPDELPTNLTRYDDYFSADRPVVAALDCTNCSFYSYVPVGTAVLRDPVLAGTMAERGRPLADRRLWELPFVVDDDRETVLATDPRRVSVLVHAAGDGDRSGAGGRTGAGAVEAVLDAELEVAELVRHRAR
jgi:DNA-binding transcriptional ArsR family regulator